MPTFRLLLVLVFIVSSLFASPAYFMRGDTTLDLRVDISDVIATLRHLFQGRRIKCQDAADANDDGELNLTDAVFTIQVLYLGGSEFPGPLCGEDETDDDLDCRVSPCGHPPKGPKS